MKTKKFQIILMVIFFYCITGCVVQTQLGKNLDTSVGNDTKYIRQNFGPPTEIIDNASAGTVWLYSEAGVKSRPGIISTIGENIIYTDPATIKYEKYIKFWVSSNEIIYRWEVKGYEVEEDHSFEVVYLSMLGITVLVLAIILIPGGGY